MSDQNHENVNRTKEQRPSPARVANYDKTCHTCGATPVVVIVERDGRRLNTGLCGACCFGSAACADPAEWVQP
jgi:hypothetical protein